MRWRPVREIWALSLREAFRTPEALFWTYGFPVLMAIALGLAFARGEPKPAQVVVPEAPGSALLAEALETHGGGRIHVHTLSPDEAHRGLTLGRFDLAVGGTPAAPQLELDRTRPEAELAELLVLRALRGLAGEAPGPAVEVREVTDRGSRYIDFLIPGLIGLNLLGAGMYGVGFSLVQMRVRNTLRRLAVTPMRRGEFLFGYLVSRLLFAIPESLFVVLIGLLGFGVPVNGSWLALLAITLAGALAFSGLGLLVAARTRTIEGISGLSNLLMLPMWILGGSFFSNERFPGFLQPLVQAMPLTHVNAALREVMLGGAGLGGVGVELAVLLGVALVSFAVALRLFRRT
jgi:ABC-type multidrug transport system permease subunit